MGIIAIIVSAFLVGFFASTVATGPVTFLVFRNALFGKFRKSVAMIFGSAVMETIYCSFALTIVGVILVNSSSVRLFSRVFSIIIFLMIGFYLFRSEHKYKPREEVEGFSIGDRTTAFFTGFILVALNPTIILTWSAAAAALISFGIIEVVDLIDIVAFTLSAGAGTIVGSLTMVFFVKWFRMSISEKFIGWMLKVMGIVVFGLAAYGLIDLVLKMI
jgi:threonine/homoserine/homoserine lactone efflux protein